MPRRERVISVLTGGTNSTLALCSATLLFLTIVALSLPPTAQAQRQSGSVGIGLQAGRPGGLVVKMYRPGPVAYDAILTTDADDFAAAFIHRVWEHPVPDSPLHFFAGPGIQVGGERLNRTPQLRLGLSTEAGLNFYVERFEVFLHVTPTLRFFPNMETSLDGNVGLRYYFGL